MTCYAGGYCPKCWCAVDVPVYWPVPIVLEPGERRWMNGMWVAKCPACQEPCPEVRGHLNLWPLGAFAKSRSWLIFTVWTFVRDLSAKPVEKRMPPKCPTCNGEQLDVTHHGGSGPEYHCVKCRTTSLVLSEKVEANP